MRYYDLIETPKTQKIFLKDGENRVKETDEKVKNWFEPLPSGKQRAFSSDGFPLLVNIVDEVISPDILKKIELERRKTEGEIYTLNDVDYKVSFTSRDQSGLIAVKMGFEDFEVEKTIFDFQNGTAMPMSPDMFYDFSLWWVKKRNSFFEDRV